MKLESEGLGRLSVFSEIWIKRVFPDFYNLATYSISKQMMNVQNQGFKKLLFRDFKTINPQYKYLVDRTNDLYSKIVDTPGVNDYVKYQNQFTKLIASTMFKYGVQFGMELKKDNFKW